ncbi:MAG: hypothetical protein ACI4A3_00165 [Lachnospiraceae bacterium]
MKKYIKTIIFTLFLCFALVPAVKSQAAVVTPEAPTGLGIYAQSKTLVRLNWDLNTNLGYYSSAYPGYYGYEIVVTTLKGKNITTITRNNYTYYTDFGLDGSGKVAIDLVNSKFKTQGFKFKVRAYVLDENQQPVYGPFSSEKAIIPRATVNKFKALSTSKGKITWSKVTGASSYTVYLSKDGGIKYKKYATTSSRSMTISNMTLSKKYYVYVVANNVKYKGKKLKSTKPVNNESNASSICIYLR